MLGDFGKVRFGFVQKPGHDLSSKNCYSVWLLKMGIASIYTTILYKVSSPAMVSCKTCPKISSLAQYTAIKWDQSNHSKDAPLAAIFTLP